MTGPLPHLIAQRRALLDKRQEEALRNGVGLEDLEALEREYAALRTIDERGRPKRPAWLIPLGVAGASLIAVALGLVIHLSPWLAFDGKVTELRFTVAEAAAEFSMRSQLPVTAFEVVGAGNAAVAGTTHLESILVQGGTRLSVTANGRGCHQLIVLSGGSLVVQVQVPPLREGEVATAHPISVGPGAGVQFCAVERKEPLVAGPVASLEISKVHREESPPILLSSIVSGTLRIGGAEGEIKLDDRDRLSIRQIDNGWLILFPGKELRAIASGRGRQAERVGVSSEDRQDLRPTLLEAARTHRDVQSLIAAFTGLVGLIWSAIRYFESR